MKNYVLDGIMGLCVGDALGVPVEFKSRETLKEKPITDMVGNRVHNQPIGTWSDDTSMTLCLLDSLLDGLDYKDIMNKFKLWFTKGDYTPYGEVFDVGISTQQAISRYMRGTKPLKCGGVEEYDNGNGSLMRILPLLFYIQSLYSIDFQNTDEAFDIIHNVSALTHAHKRSQIACGIYLSIASMLMKDVELEVAVEIGIQKAFEYYNKLPEFKKELIHFKRLSKKHFYKTKEYDIRSSGYVVDTLEASVWCLLNTKTYKDCVLKAVNLGGDTDTTSAVVGGLAGLYYGIENIPSQWIKKIARRNYIENISDQFYQSLVKK